MILWDINTGQKTDVLYQPNGEAIRNGMFSPDGSVIATTDDTGTICVFGQNKSLKLTIKGVHEESIPTLTFSKDSRIMLTACSMGNVRMFFNDFEGNDIEKAMRKTKRSYFISADVIEPDLLIDGAHDMGCMSADFCRVTRLDRKCINHATD